MTKSERRQSNWIGKVTGQIWLQLKWNWNVPLSGISNVPALRIVSVSGWERFSRFTGNRRVPVSRVCFVRYTFRESS